MKKFAVWGCVIQLLMLPVCVSGAGRQAKATATVVQGFVSGIDVTDGGSGYRSAPQVSLSGGGGSGASALAVLQGDAVQQIIVINAGASYSEVPSVSIEPPLDTRVQKLWQVETLESDPQPFWFFGADLSAITLHRESTVWISSNGVFRIPGLMATNPKLVTAQKVIFLGMIRTNDFGITHVLATIHRDVSGKLSADFLNLASIVPPDGTQVQAVPADYAFGGILPQGPLSRRDCFCMLNSNGDGTNRYTGFRILDPDLVPQVTVAPVALNGTSNLVFSINNTSGDTTEILTTQDLKTWKSLVVIPDPPISIKVANPVSSFTNFFLRAIER